MGTKNKYIVYIDYDYIKMETLQIHGNDTMSYRHEVELERMIMAHVARFLSGDDSKNVFFSSTFIGSDGKRHRTVEIKAVPGFGNHAGRVLKRIKKLRKYTK